MSEGRAARSTSTTSASVPSRGSRRPTGGASPSPTAIPRERGLGSSAAVIALGLVAPPRSRRDAPRARRSSSRRASSSRATRDNLAAALAGGVCLTWDTRIARLADRRARRPDRARPGGDGLDRRRPGRAAGADARTRDAVVHDRARRAARSRARDRDPPTSSPRRSTTACTSRYRARNAPLLEEVRARLPAGALGATLSGSGPTVIVWARDDDVGCRAQPSSPARYPSVRRPHPARLSERSPRAVTSDPYSRPSDPAKRRSAALTDGPDRAPAPRDAQGRRASPTTTSPSRSSASRRRGSRRCRATSTSASSPSDVKRGHPGSGRDADRVQHDLGLGRRVDGHRRACGPRSSRAR